MGSSFASLNALIVILSELNYRQVCLYNCKPSISTYYARWVMYNEYNVTNMIMKAKKRVRTSVCTRKQVDV